MEQKFTQLSNASGVTSDDDETVLGLDRELKKIPASQMASERSMQMLSTRRRWSTTRGFSAGETITGRMPGSAEIFRGGGGCASDNGWVGSRRCSARGPLSRFYYYSWVFQRSQASIPVFTASAIHFSMSSLTSCTLRRSEVGLPFSSRGTFSVSSSSS